MNTYYFYNGLTLQHKIVLQNSLILTNDYIKYWFSKIIDKQSPDITSASLYTKLNFIDS